MLQKLQADGKYALLLVDVQMPGINGLDLLERPWLDLHDETSLAAGMVLTPEPWFRGSGTTVMVEETVLVTEKGAEPLVPWGFETLRTIDE